MKGFAITIDSVVAVSFFFFAICIISSQTYQPNSPGGIYLKQLTLDTMAVLEKTGRFAQAIDGNSSAISEVLEATPQLACMEITITGSDGELVASSTKSGCNETAGLDMQNTAMPAFYADERYTAKAISWFRKEPD